MIDLRVLALNILYDIPGYAECSLELKNYLYDTVMMRFKEVQHDQRTEIMGDEGH